MARIHSAIDALPIVRHKIKFSVKRCVGFCLFQRVFLNCHLPYAIALIGQSSIELSGKFKVHCQIHRITVDGGVSCERNELIVDVHISCVLKLSHNARTLFVQHTQIKRHPLVEYRRCRVALHLFAHGFIVIFAIDVAHISTLSWMHRIVQIHPSIVHR